MPSAFTLGNLFFGFWSIVSAFNGNFRWAGWFIVFAGILDMLDGRVARLSNTGTRFGAELDSLVDVISFGVAPALLIYFLDFASAGRFSWILCYIYVTAVALRLARFNVLSAGKPSTGWVTGLPSPSPSPGAAPSSFDAPAEGTQLPATTLSGPGVGDYVLATTGGQREPGGDASWRALILGPLR